jgi:hypothetical protein
VLLFSVRNNSRLTIILLNNMSISQKVKVGRVMDQSFQNPDDNNIDDLFYSYQYTDEIFKAFVDAIIPRTPGLAEEFGKVQYYGALDLSIDEYMILSLNNFYFPLAYPTAQMLNIAAEQLVFLDRNIRLELSKYTGWNTFAVLTPYDRFRALTLLEDFRLNLSDLPIPFQDNPGYILYISSTLNRLTLMGYYSEWSGYGSTRLEAPDQRRLEYFPISWKQVGYPGPSLGYHALRME